MTEVITTKMAKAITTKMAEVITTKNYYDRSLSIGVIKWLISII